MSRQLYFDGQTDTLRHTIPARKWAEENLFVSPSPFKPSRLLSRVARVFASTATAFVEWLTGNTLYIENRNFELAIIGGPSRRLLQRLVAEKIISSWAFDERSVDAPYVAQCVLVAGNYRLPSGRAVVFQGSTSSGIGATLDEALLPAMAETLERHALCSWDEAMIVQGTLAKVSRAVNPQQFLSYSQAQILSDYFSRSRINDGTVFRWVTAQDFVSGSSVRIPAQTVYLNFEREYFDEPLLGATTSNGAAAATTHIEACVRAIHEAVERDAFFMHWLNTLAPSKIDLATIADAEALKNITNLKTFGFELHILDITTDIGMPTLCGVLIDHRGALGVMVATATGPDVVAVLRKVLLDLIRSLHVDEFEDTGSGVELREAKNISSFTDRRKYWSGAERAKDIAWFIAGPVSSFGQIQEKYQPTAQLVSAKAVLGYYRSLFKQKAYDCYVVDITTAIAKSSGLSIVKAIIPELVPIYFDEQRPPLGRKRLDLISGVLRIEKPRTPARFNTIPHPFI